MESHESMSALFVIYAKNPTVKHDPFTLSHTVLTVLVHHSDVACVRSVIYGIANAGHIKAIKLKIQWHRRTFVHSPERHRAYRTDRTGTCPGTCPASTLSVTRELWTRELNNQTTRAWFQSEFQSIKIYQRYVLNAHVFRYILNVN